MATGDDRADHPAGADRWSGGAATRRWPLPGPARPRDSTPDEPPVCFAPVEHPVDDAAAPPAFSTVRRGYDPGEVDSYLGSLGARLTAAETERRRADIAEDQLREALTELKRARSDADRAPTVPAETGSHGRDEGFGPRVERMLSAAQREAEQERGAAVEQAAHLLAGARAEAESHRQEVERALTERTAAKEDELRGREDELRGWEEELAGREREVTDRLADARAEAAAITRDAEAAASQRAREMLDDAAREAAADRDRVNRDVLRLTEVRRTLRAELAGLHRDLSHRLAAGPDAGDDPGAGGTDPTVAPQAADGERA